ERRGRERRHAFESLLKKLHAHDRYAAEKFAKDFQLFETFGGYREAHKKYLVFVVAILRKKILMQAEELVALKKLDSVEQVFDLTVEQLDASRHDNSRSEKARAREYRFPKTARTRKETADGHRFSRVYPEPSNSATTAR